jgi:putative transcriptional regulator
MTQKTPKRPTPGRRALAALDQVHAHIRGEAVPGLVVRKPVDVKAVRQKTGLSQDAFASAFGLSAATLREWEQNRRTPERSAQILLGVIEVAPEIVRQVVERQAEKVA